MSRLLKLIFRMSPWPFRCWNPIPLDEFRMTMFDITMFSSGPWSHPPKSMASNLIAEDLDSIVQLSTTTSLSGSPREGTLFALVLPDANTMPSSPVEKVESST